MISDQYSVLSLILALVLPVMQGGAAPVSTSVVARAKAPAVPLTGEVDIKADKLEWDRESGWAEGTGNVRVLSGEDKLTADYVRVNTKTEQAEAFGNVVLTRPTGVTVSEHLSYNFRTQQGVAEDLGGVAAPFHWVSESAQRASTNSYVLHNAEVTTCIHKGKDRHFHVKAREITVVPNQSMKAKHAVWYFGRVPSLYLPYWYRSLKDTGCGFNFQPGYHSRMGAFLLSSYRCTMLPWLKTETHLDYRTRRGVGLGQDFRWHQPGTAWSGDIELYALDDKRPVDADEDAATSDIDNNRYRIRLRHRYYPSTQNYALLRASFLSDTDVEEDFFRSDYRRGAQPENYLIYTHRGDGYLANALVRKRLNNFYTTMERLPELSADLFRQQIGDSGFYYEAGAAVGHLQQTWEKASANEDYSVVRGDTTHWVYRPYRLFGFLNMVPRAGYRGTWYSETIDDESEGGSDVRSLFELGHEVSFKAFRVWQNAGTTQRAYRHIVEPYANYNWVGSSGLAPGEIPYFDSVDAVGEEHWVELGVRNTLQTKQGTRAKNLVDLNIFTWWAIDREDDEDAIENIFFDAELFPSSSIRVDMDARYNLPDSSVNAFNTRLWAWHDQAWSVGVEQRYAKDSSSLWSGAVRWKPSQRWNFENHVRFEAQEDRLEEVGGYVQRNYDCLSLRTGADIMPGYRRTDGTEREDEWRVMIEFWLTAFPSTRMRLR